MKSNFLILWKSPIYLPAMIAVLFVVEIVLLVLPPEVDPEDVKKTNEMIARKTKLPWLNICAFEYGIFLLLMVFRKLFPNRIFDNHINLLIDAIAAGVFNLELVLFLLWYTPKKIKQIGSTTLKNGDQIILWILSVMNYLAIVGLAVLMIAGGASLIKGI